MSVASVADYLAGMEPQGRARADRLMAFMAQNFPQLSAKISFSMPMWLVGSKMKDGYVAFSVAKKHFTVHFSDEAFVALLQAQVPSCKRGKRCINIPYGDEAAFETVLANIRTFLQTFQTFS